MKLSKKLIISAVLIFAYTLSSAQNYNTGIGIRLGGATSGITLKHFVNSNSALEGILGFSHKSLILTGLYERHLPINNAKGLQWFYGGGAHLGFFGYNGYYRSYKDHGHYYVVEEGENSVALGLDFILGLDYKFNNAPINIGLDIKPFIDFHDGVYGYWDGAFSFRFVF
ncbi:MAG: hypothetical protein ABIT08_09475 [Bacteroidia bacterium]